MKPLVSPAATLSGTEVERPGYNLMLRITELAGFLDAAMRRSEWLDAFLFCAAMNQIAEDYVHEDIGYLGAVGDRLLVHAGGARAGAGRATSAALTAAQDLRSHRRPMRATLAWQRQLAALVGMLAQVVVDPGRSDEQALAGLEADLRAVLRGADSLPAELRERTARLPGCFKAFDLDVSDVSELAAGFAESRPDRSRPLLVTGVRTAGSYLAPLCAAALELLGYADVRVLTLRPGHRPLAGERDLIRRVARTHGLALVIDDPPESGRSVDRVAADLARLGLSPESIVLLLPLFGDRLSLADSLAKYPSILLTAGEWSIDDKLRPVAVSRALEGLLAPGREVVQVEQIPLPLRRWQRSHRRALFRVGLIENGAQQALLVLVEGVGIGYLGEQTRAVAERLPDHVPEILGLREGCLYRVWLPDEDRICQPGAPPDDDLVSAVARYVADRRLALPVAEDRSVGEFGSRPVWEVASTTLSRTFGRGAPAARLLFVDALAKQLLQVTHPSVVDGDTSLSNWFSDASSPGRPVKVEFAGRSFWNLGLLCYDAAFDLAGAALSSTEDTTADRLRSAFSGLVGEPIGEERWLLYELAQLWGRGRTRPEDSPAVEREQARALRRYLARLYLEDVAPAREGPLCALDLDGVLETESLGFPGMTQAGATALRALVCHGYRPVLVSGRSAGDVADRCRSYGLAGGVAEYGAVVYVADGDESHVLLDGNDRAMLARARDALSARPRVWVDDAYQFSVRAFALDRHTRRKALDPATVSAVLDEADGHSSLEVVVGESQTDFMAAGADKGTGARALAARLDRSGSNPPFAFAVGDTAADLPMLRQAALRFVPAHAGAALAGEEDVELLKAPYQAGLALAVARLIGHEPGSCPTCRVPRLSPEAGLLVALLSAGEAGRLELARRFLRLRRRAREFRATPRR